MKPQFKHLSQKLCLVLCKQGLLKRFFTLLGSNFIRDSLENIHLGKASVRKVLRHVHQLRIGEFIKLKAYARNEVVVYLYVSCLQVSIQTEELIHAVWVYRSSCQCFAVAL